MIPAKNVREAAAEIAAKDEPTSNPRVETRGDEILQRFLTTAYPTPVSQDN